MMIVYFYEGNLLFSFFYSIVEFVKRNDFFFFFVFGSFPCFVRLASHSSNAQWPCTFQWKCVCACVLSHFFCLLFPESFAARKRNLPVFLLYRCLILVFRFFLCMYEELGQMSIFFLGDEHQSWIYRRISKTLCNQSVFFFFFLSVIMKI